jgi:hypothetical protein
VQNLAGERALHVTIFLLLLVGICGISGWIISSYTPVDYLLRIAGIALIWGIVLLALYVGFRALNWKWWE